MEVLTTLYKYLYGKTRGMIICIENANKYLCGILKSL